MRTIFLEFAVGLIHFYKVNAKQAFNIDSKYNSKNLKTSLLWHIISFCNLLKRILSSIEQNYKETEDNKYALIHEIFLFVTHCICVVKRYVVVQI